MTRSDPLSLRTEFRTHWRWFALLAGLPLLYIALIVLPPPLGLGRDFGNDFADHRIWWIQMDAFWLSHGQVPLWNPLDQFGASHFGARGIAWFYPFRWWLYLPAVWMPSLNYLAQYTQIVLHMGAALAGIFVLLRRHTPASPAAAAFAAMPFLLTQRFNDFVRYPQGIEAMAWIPWILVAALECSRAGATPAERKLWAWRLAACTALSLLAGYGQISYIGALFTGIVLLCAARSGSGLLVAVGGGLLGIITSIGSLYPVAMQATMTIGRKGGDPAWANQFLPPDYLDMWLRPFAAEVHGSAFFPVIFVALAGLGMAVALTRRPNGLAWGMLAALVLVVDLSRGEKGMLFSLFYEHAPMFHAFRNQGRNFWPAFIAISFFSAHALAWIEENQKRTLGFFLFIVAGTSILGVIAWGIAGPFLVPTGHLGYSSLENGWITLAGSRWAYSLVLLSGVIALGLFLFCRKASLRLAACLILAVGFVLGFAQFNTWFAASRPRQAETSVRDAYPAGLFEANQARPKGILGVWGASEAALPRFDAYVRLQPSPEAAFPASRFYFAPHGTGGPAHAEMRVQNFDANHFAFSVRSNVPGTLIYFHTPDPLWRSNVPFRAWPEKERLFMAFEITGPTDLVQLSFTPPGLIAAGLVSVVGPILLLALAAGVHLRSRWGLASILAGTFAALLFLTGALLPHELDSRLLTGVSRVNAFEWHSLPTGPDHR